MIALSKEYKFEKIDDSVTARADAGMGVYGRLLSRFL